MSRICEAIEETDANDDDGSHDLLVSDVLPVNETQVWYINERLDPTPVIDSQPK